MTATKPKPASKKPAKKRRHILSFTLDPAEAQPILEEWLDAVARLQEEVRTWVRNQPGWELLPFDDKEIKEAPFGTYTVSIVHFKTTTYPGLLEPKARNIGGGDGLVTLSMFPGLNRVGLYYDSDDQSWTVRTDSWIRWPHPWSEATFVELVNGLMET